MLTRNVSGGNNKDALCDLVSFVLEKHPWKSVTFSKVAGKKPAT